MNGLLLKHSIDHQCLSTLSPLTMSSPSLHQEPSTTASVNSVFSLDSLHYKPQKQQPPVYVNARSTGTPTTGQLSTSEVIVSRRKKKSHLSRDELARVCNEGEVAFESYNGSTYMVAVRSLGERKSLIGYRCDWNACGYMNARVERMFGHIRSQHPEAPPVKKLPTTNGGGTPTTATMSSASSPTASVTSVVVVAAPTVSARLSNRSSSSLSTGSSGSLSVSSSQPTSPVDHGTITSVDDEDCNSSKNYASRLVNDKIQQKILLKRLASESSDLNRATTKSLCDVGGNRLIDLLKRERDDESQPSLPSDSLISTSTEQILAELKTISSQTSTSPSTSSDVKVSTMSVSPSIGTSNVTPEVATNFNSIDRNNNHHLRQNIEANLVDEHYSNRNFASAHQLPPPPPDDLLDLESLLTQPTPASIHHHQHHSAPPPSYSEVEQPKASRAQFVNKPTCNYALDTLGTSSGDYSQHYSETDYRYDQSHQSRLVNDNIRPHNYLAYHPSSLHESDPGCEPSLPTQQSQDEQDNLETEASESSPPRKKTTSSKNYIGKQNLFQEFLSEDVAKIRDTENRYIIALQKETKIVGYRCDWPECEFLTCRKYVMVNHINGKHTNQRPFPCSMCNFSFVKRYFLKAHLHKVHKQPMGEEKEEIDEIEVIKRSNMTSGMEFDEDSNSLEKAVRSMLPSKRHKKDQLVSRHPNQQAKSLQYPVRRVMAPNVSVSANDYFANDPLTYGCANNGYINNAPYSYESNQTAYNDTFSGSFYSSLDESYLGSDQSMFNEKATTVMTPSPSSIASPFSSSTGGGVGNGPLTPSGKPYPMYEGQYNECYSPTTTYNSPLRGYTSGYQMPSKANGASSQDLLTPPHSASVQNPLGLLPTATNVAPSGTGIYPMDTTAGGAFNFNDHGKVGSGYLPLASSSGGQMADEFLSPPSSISSNGSNSFSSVSYPGGGGCSSDLQSQQQSPAGTTARARAMNTTPTSMASASSFYMHTPSPSPSSLSHSPAAVTGKPTASTTANNFDSSGEYAGGRSWATSTPNNYYGQPTGGAYGPAVVGGYNSMSNCYGSPVSGYYNGGSEVYTDPMGAAITPTNGYEAGGEWSNNPTAAAAAGGW